MSTEAPTGEDLVQLIMKDIEWLRERNISVKQVALGATDYENLYVHAMRIADCKHDLSGGFEVTLAGNPIAVIGGPGYGSIYVDCDDGSTYFRDMRSAPWMPLKRVDREPYWLKFSAYLKA
ncbi:MAG: hypothetical protein JOZ73_12070 [Solirubrobacterales bacterium]|nr:hypothetical protein [Solirubrobacterales bacterium]